MVKKKGGPRLNKATTNTINGATKNEEVLEWENIVLPYGLEAKDFHEYENIFRLELRNFAKTEIQNMNFIQLIGAAGKEVKAMELQHRGKQVRYEVFDAPLGDNLKGGDRCLKQLGIRLASPSGAITGILGRETILDITEWTNFDSEIERRSRISVVHTAHESVRQEALQRFETRKKRAR